MTIADITRKITNRGKTADGRLTAEEFNALLDAVKANKADVAELQTLVDTLRRADGGQVVYTDEVYDRPSGATLASLLEEVRQIAAYEFMTQDELTEDLQVAGLG